MSQPRSKAVLWVSYVLSALPAMLLLFSAFGKFTSPPPVLEGMAHLGWPTKYLLIIGITEVTCTVLYLIPRTSVLGAVLLTGYLGGAVATHARIGETQLVMAAILGVVVWLGLWLREDRLK